MNEIPAIVPAFFVLVIFFVVCEYLDKAPDFKLLFQFVIFPLLLMFMLFMSQLFFKWLGFA